MTFNCWLKNCMNLFHYQSKRQKIAPGYKGQSNLTKNWNNMICHNLFTGKKKEKTMLYIFELWNQIKTIDKGYLWQKMPNISKWWWPYGITVPLLVIQIVEFQAGTTEIKFPFQNKIFLSSYLLSNSISYPNFNFKFQNFKSPAPSQVNKK